MNNSDKFRIFKWLDDNGYIQYGKVIRRETLESIFCAKMEDGWSFLGPYLSLKTFLEEEGYMCTNEGQLPGDLKIYDADEIGDQVNRIVVNSFKRLSRAQKCMTNTKMTALDHNEMRRHMHESNKLQSILYSIKDRLKELE